MEKVKKFYDATNDSMFKAIFTKPKNKDLLENLIGEALKTKVEVISILPPETPKENINEKGKTLDVLVKANNKTINIELNSNYYSTLHRRNAAYVFKEYSTDLNSGEDYSQMNNHIQINFTNNLDKTYPLVGVYQLVDPETGKLYVDNLIIYEFNLQKVKEKCYNEHDKRYSLIAALVCNREELEEISKGDPILEKYKNEVERMNEDREFANMMDQEEEARKLHNTLISEAKNDGFVEGRSEGITEGETNKAVEIAKKMLAKNKSIEEIVEYTDLTPEEIKKLKKELR